MGMMIVYAHFLIIHKVIGNTILNIQKLQIVGGMVNGYNLDLIKVALTDRNHWHILIRDIQPTEGQSVKFKYIKINKLDC